MTVLPKDLKILWGKAAARCSMSDCRSKLSAQASKSVPSGAILIGENCHIVAESDAGPRGNSCLSLIDRNRYPNLILLCAIHHTIIDSDPGSWPIERLHQIKADHELWVETQLTVAMDDVAEYYSRLVNGATEQLILSRWNWVSDHAFRWILPDEFYEGALAFHKMVKLAVWPSGYAELKLRLINLSMRLYAYVEHFSTRSEYIAHKTFPRHREDKSWKHQFNNDYEMQAAASSAWKGKSSLLLANVVVALNEYADEVRASLNPSYLLYQGKFGIEDTMGMTTDGESGVFYLPTEYAEDG